MKIISALFILLLTMNTLYAQQTRCDVRYANHPDDAKHYDTERLRKEFLIETVFEPDKVNMVYTLYDRFVFGGAMPVENELKLEAVEAVKAPNFLHRREIGIVNIGGDGIVTVGDTEYELGLKEALYVGSGSHEVFFRSKNSEVPAKFYFNSATAHKSYPIKKITLKEAQIVKQGSTEGADARTLVRFITKATVDRCQLVMGMTEMEPGNVWNQKPPHRHIRRVEAYLYFNLPKDQAICHVLGEPQETRALWVHNEQAIIAAHWSMHFGIGTSAHSMLWGMAGENDDPADVEIIQPFKLR